VLAVWLFLARSTSSTEYAGGASSLLNNRPISDEDDLRRSSFDCFAADGLSLVAVMGAGVVDNSGGGSGGGVGGEEAVLFGSVPCVPAARAEAPGGGGAGGEATGAALDADADAESGDDSDDGAVSLRAKGGGGGDEEEEPFADATTEAAALAREADRDERRRCGGKDSPLGFLRATLVKSTVGLLEGQAPSLTKARYRRRHVCSSPQSRIRCADMPLLSSRGATSAPSPAVAAAAAADESAAAGAVVDRERGGGSCVGASVSGSAFAGTIRRHVAIEAADPSLVLLLRLLRRMFRRLFRRLPPLPLLLLLLSAGAVPLSPPLHSLVLGLERRRPLQECSESP